MAFEKITDTSLANKGVTGLPDVPGLSTAEMQAKFDELSRDVIIPKLNEIVDGLNGDEVGLSSKIENPETKEKDVIQNVVNAIYQIVKENSDKRHGHENKETLDKVTAELYDSITTLVSMFNGISSIDKTVTADDTKIPTSGAIVNYAIELGAGDMQKAVYDKNNTGIVDNAEKLGGVAPEEYLQKASLPDTTVAFAVAETRSNISTGEKVSTVFGKIKKFFADLTAPAFAQMITTKEDLLATKVTGYVPDAKAVADGFADVNGKLIASDNVPFRFGVNSNGEYGYIITNPAGADTVIPFSSEASYAAALYNALKPSGLVNANMTFNQLIAVVASQNPATYSLIRSGWTIGTAGGAITPSASSNGSAVTLKIASQTGMNSYVYYTSPAINLSSFKTLTLQGSSYKVTGNPYGSDDYRPKVKLLNASGVEVTTLYAHPNYDKEKTTYTINTSYNCSSLSGNYYLRLQMFSYSSTDSTNVGSYITLTKALFST